MAAPSLKESDPESKVEESSSHLDFLDGVVEGVREEKVEAEFIPGVAETSLLVPELNVNLAFLEEGSDTGVATGEGGGREDETT